VDLVRENEYETILTVYLHLLYKATAFMLMCHSQAG